MAPFASSLARGLAAVAALLAVAAEALGAGAGAGQEFEVQAVVVAPCRALLPQVPDACAARGPLPAGQLSAIDAERDNANKVPEPGDLADVALDPVTLGESATAPDEGLLVFAFVGDVAAPLSFRAGEGLRFLPDDGNGGWLCTGRDDPDCGGDADERDGVVTVNLVNASARAGDRPIISVGYLEPDGFLIGAVDTEIVITGEDRDTVTSTVVPRITPRPTQTPTDGDDEDGGNGHDDDGWAELLLGFIILGTLALGVAGGAWYFWRRLFGARTRIQLVRDAGAAELDADAAGIVEFRATLGEGTIDLEVERDDAP